MRDVGEGVWERGGEEVRERWNDVFFKLRLIVSE
jgi:hypothetical protein